MIRANRHAFTLIELMIAVALGALIVYTAVAGFSAASTAITRANRLSLDNGLLRASYFQAQAYLDFWTDLDDPEADQPASNPLRATQAVRGLSRPRGLPFTPMRTVNPTFDGDWLPHDPRGWYRGNLVDGYRESTLIWENRSGRWVNASEDPVPPDSYPHLLFGRYALFSGVEDTPSNLAYRINTDPNPSPTTVDHGIDRILTLRYDAPVAHAGIRDPLWYARQLNGLIDGLGYYAFCEYLPSNLAYAWYGSANSRTAPAGIPLRLLRDGDTGGLPGGAFFDRAESDRDGRAPVAHGLFRQTFSTAHGVFNPRAMPAELADNHYRSFAADRAAASEYDRENLNSRNQELQKLLTRTAHLETLCARLPDTWVRPFVAVGRFVKEGHFVRLARVQGQHPLTGEIVELSWAGLGSTLRGARMQRRSDRGWAAWDNRATARNDPHLDSP
jgi:prepilin-type N-terminal cleavage/methylation domain-containing protein